MWTQRDERRRRRRRNSVRRRAQTRREADDLGRPDRASSPSAIGREDRDLGRPDQPGQAVLGVPRAVEAARARSGPRRGPGA